MKKFDATVIGLASRDCKIPEATGRRRVSILVVLPKRMRAVDEDSLFKSCLDALVHCGLLVNDSSKWCHLGEVKFVRGERLETTIILEEVSDK